MSAPNSILHLTGSVSLMGGGIPVAVGGLMNQQLVMSQEVHLIGWDDGDEVLPELPQERVQISPLRRRFGLPMGIAMKEQVEVHGASLIHLHGLWTGCSMVSANDDRPRVISPHGMLDGWALKRSSWKKKLASWCFENRNLKNAACLHALCEAEAEAIRAHGLDNPIAVIPNGVDLPNLESASESREHGKTLLFLGRMHPKKGLPDALRAWSSQIVEDGGDWKLIIAGWDQEGHQTELMDLCDELRLTHATATGEAWLNGSVDADATVLFIGPVSGKTKERVLQRADAFILPSYSEGLPMSVLEAWAYGLPTLMTDACNLPEGFEQEAAIRICHHDEFSVRQGLQRLFTMSPTELARMGLCGRELVEQRFSWVRIAEQFHQLYEWVLEGGEAPSFVHL